MNIIIGAATKQPKMGQNRNGPKSPWPSLSFLRLILKSRTDL